MAKNFYAVRVGRKVGIFKDWDTCKDSIQGFSGARYKGFNTEEEALSYLSGVDSCNKVINQKIINISKNNEVNLIVKTSFSESIINIGIFMNFLEKSIGFYGVVSSYNFDINQGIEKDLIGVLLGVELAIDMGFSVINIYYDYQGCECWYSGSWKCRTELSQLYNNILNTLRVNSNVCLNFIKKEKNSNLPEFKKAELMLKRNKIDGRYIDMDKLLKCNIKVNDIQYFYL